MPIIGYCAQQGARKPDQIVGLFAIFATFVGIYVSLVGLMARGGPGPSVGVIFMLFNFVAAIWISFQRASTLHIIGD